MTIQRKTPLAGGVSRAALLAEINSDHTGNSATSQRTRIIRALEWLGSITTIECSRYLSIIHPPRRIMELRRDGYAILTAWDYMPDEQGQLHRVGRYVAEVQP
jgi:hypothetical protein